MALTKLTKHVVHGATIVQVRYKEDGSHSWNNTSTQTVISMTLTPEYSDSVLEVAATGMIRCPSHNSGNTGDSANHDVYLNINNSNEYVIENAHDTGTLGHGYTRGHTDGSSFSMFHRHLPGTTNLQTIKLNVVKNSTNGGTSYLDDSFMIAKEIAGGITTGTPSNNYVN